MFIVLSRPTIIAFPCAWSRSFGLPSDDYAFLRPYLTDVLKQQVGWEYRLKKSLNLRAMKKAEDGVSLNHRGVNGIYYTNHLKVAVRGPGCSA